jgi:hypothetical protein
MPPARTTWRVLCSVVGCVNSSAQKRCIQSSQFTGIPRYTSQTPMRKDKGPRAEDKKKRKSSNGEGARWQEQDEGGSAGGKDGGTLR